MYWGMMLYSYVSAVDCRSWKMPMNVCNP